MKHIALENELKKRIKKRRAIEVLLSVIFFIIAIAFTIAYEQSKVIETIDWGFIEHQSVTYNQNLIWGMIVGWLGFVPAIIFLIGDFVFSRLVTVQLDKNYITFYRGLLHNNLYVNGEYKDGLSLFGYYLEASLPDGTKVNAALGKWSAHLTFSNGQPPIDL